jgi:hypothetical protein
MKDLSTLIFLNVAITIVNSNEPKRKKLEIDNPLALVDIKKTRNTRKWLVFSFVKFIEYQVSSIGVS